MEQKIKSPKMIRQRKFAMVLPALILPFMTLMFWALGGGQLDEANAQTKEQTGINLNLPNAHLKEDKDLNKMDYYNQAQLDSMKYKELVKNDPNYQHLAYGEPEERIDEEISWKERGMNTSLYDGSSFNDPNEEKIYQKLAQLDQELNRPQEPEYFPYATPKYENPQNPASLNSSDVDRLEQMMQMMGEPEGEDEEMQQLSGMLDKILDIQHPERIRNELRSTSEQQRGQVFAVGSVASTPPVSMLASNLTEVGSSNGFYSLSNQIPNDEEMQNAIAAVIHETQTLVNGSTVKLRLVNDVFINGVLIPKDHFIFGTAALNGERLVIKVNSIRQEQSLFPVALSVYDMDGLNGIYIPGAIARNVAKQSADQSMQSIGLSSLDPSWSAQAASAGVEAAKTLFSKKVRLTKVTVKAGYQVLLKDEKQKNTNH